MFYYTILRVWPGCGAVSAPGECVVDSRWLTEHVLGAAPARVSVSYFSEALRSSSCRGLAPEGLMGQDGRLEPRAHQGVSGKVGHTECGRFKAGWKQNTELLALWDRCGLLSARHAAPGCGCSFYRNRSQPENPFIVLKRNRKPFDVCSRVGPVDSGLLDILDQRPRWSRFLLLVVTLLR